MAVHSNESSPLNVLPTRLRHTQCDFCPKILCDFTEYLHHSTYSTQIESLDLWKSFDVCFVKMPNDSTVRKQKIRLHPGFFISKKLSLKNACDYKNRVMIINCEFCADSRFSSYTSLHKHVNKEHESEILARQWLPCNFCNLKLPSNHTLERHQNKVHKVNQKGSLNCSFCVKVFARGAYFIDHANKDHQNEVSALWQKCEKCRKFYPTSGMLKSHLTRSHGVKKSLKDKFQCKFCQAFLSTSASYVAHSNDLHLDRLIGGEGQWSQCSQCKTFFPDKDVLNNHFNHSHSDKTLRIRGKIKSCMFCQKKFHTPLKVYRHVADDHRLLVEKEWHCCKKCDIFFPTKLSLTFHNNKARHSIGELKLTCPFCPSSFTGKGKMYRHANKIHKNLVIMDWLLCSNCDTYMPDETVLASHIINAHSKSTKGAELSSQRSMKKFDCEYCSTYLKTEDEYFQHVNKKHQESILNTWTACLKCRLLLPSQKHVEGHPCSSMSVPSVVQEEQVEIEMSEFIVEIDDEIPPPSEEIQCTLCPENLSDEHEFHKHNNQIDSSNVDARSTPFQESCHRHFIKSTVHFITISDTWHMCTTCKMYFPSISALQSHYSGHHIPGNLPTMRIICTQCNEAFDKMNDFYWHVNQNHLDNIAAEWSMCDICNFFVPDYDSLLQHKSYFHEKEAS